MILTNEKELRIKSQDVSSVEEANDIIKKLEHELKISAVLGKPGIGLAAPQIGIYKKVAIVRVPGEQEINMANAFISKSYDKILFKNEGCLSFPGVSVDTYRYNEVVVTNNLLYPDSFVVSGLLAVVVQHELDHLNGTVLLDRVIKKLK